jgi:hypothetical protein
MYFVQHRLSFLLDMMYGLRAIHNVGMIHGDLKTLNLLVTLEGRVKVADFGLSKLLGTVSIVPGTKTISGTPQYMAPEVMHCQAQGLRVDIYSVGIILWEMMTGVIPWKDMDYVQIIQRVTHQANEKTRPPPGRPAIDNKHRAVSPDGYIQLIEDCWAQDPKVRPSADLCVEYLEQIKRRTVNPNFLTEQGLVGATAQTPLGGNSFAATVNPLTQRPGGEVPPQIADASKAGQREMEDRGFAGPEPKVKRQRVEGMLMDGFWDRELQPHRQVSLQPQRQVEPEFRNPLYPPNMFMASGGIHILVDMLKSYNLDKVLQALSAVFEMCVNNTANQQAIFQQGNMLEHILPFLECWDRPEVQIKCTNCIAVASSQNPHNRRVVVNTGAIATLVRLLSATPPHQEAAAQAIANVVKRPTAEEQLLLKDWDIANGKGTVLDAQEELNRFGGVEKLVQLMETGIPRVKSAAAAAVANAMTESIENRLAFQEANGMAHAVRMLRDGDCNAQV